MTIIAILSEKGDQPERRPSFLVTHLRIVRSLPPGFRSLAYLLDDG